MKEEKKKENIIITIMASLGFLVAYIIVGNLLQLGIQIFCYFSEYELRNTDYAAYTRQVQNFFSVNFLYIGIANLLLSCIVLLLFFRIKKMNPLSYVRWNPVSGQMTAFVAVFAVCNIVTLNFLLAYLIPPSWLQEASDYTTAVTNGGIFLNVAFVMLFAPFLEEVLMRGLITSRLMGRLPIWFTVGFPVILFGLGHASGGMGQIIGTIITGLVFTLAFVWTNSLRMAVLAHILSNMCAVLIPWNTVMAGMHTSVQLFVGMGGVVLTVFFGYMIYKRRNIVTA